MGKYQECGVGLKLHPEGGRVKSGLCRKLTGRACRKQTRTAAEKMREREFIVSLDLKLGAATATILTCDLSYDYVKINAEYTT